MSTQKEVKYAHGHHTTVLKSHLWRTKENSCGYLLPYITPAMSILDVGCGPGNITVDLATIVPEGKIIGLDRSEKIVEQAATLAKEKGQTNAQFKAGDVFALPFPDDSFDIVHSHQVLQHVGDASRALKEMKRVVKPGGIVAARDMSHFLHWPPSKELARFVDVFWKIAENTGGQPGTGMMLRKFAREAGFAEDKTKVTGSTWTYASKEGLEFWCSMWADRVLVSEFKDNALKLDIATEEELKQISEAFTAFITTQDAWYTVVHGELIAYK